MLFRSGPQGPPGEAGGMGSGSIVAGGFQYDGEDVCINLWGGATCTGSLGCPSGSSKMNTPVDAHTTGGTLTMYLCIKN